MFLESEREGERDRDGGREREGGREGGREGEVKSVCPQSLYFIRLDILCLLI